MSRVIDQRLISSAMLAALAEHEGADTLKIFEMPIKVCISYTSKVGEVINDKDVIAELDNRFTIHNMPLAVFHKICGRMSKGKNKVLESLPNNTYRLIADLTTIEEEFRKQENLTNAEIMQIIEKLKKWLEQKVPRFNKDENYVSGIFDKFIKSRGIDILFETENLRADVVNTVGVENYQIGCFILHAKENDTLLFDRMTEIIKGVMIASIIYLGSNEAMQTFFEVTGRLVHRGDISEDEAADMRYSAYARAEIMHISGGNTSKLDDTTVLNVHNRVKENYAQEENIRAKKAEKQLEEANVRTNKALNALSDKLSFTKNGSYFLYQP